MERLGPFEDLPCIAVAVSGGGDSMALLHLTHEWATARAGSAVAITVDHAIRPESAVENLKVAGWASRLGVEHISLRWADPRAEDGALQARAREARYELLAGAALSRGILHLATAHHADDQAETLLLRLARGSGPDGLACMSAILPMADVQLLRPLLGFPAARLKATCAARGQDWIEDPSNTSLHFARPRLREARDALAQEGLTVTILSQSATAFGQTRAALERIAAAALAASVRIYPQGHARLSLAAWNGEDPEIQRRVLAALVYAIGGGEYPPASSSLMGAVEWLTAGEGNHTFGGCLLKKKPAELAIMREQRNLPSAPLLATGVWQRWDRFRVFGRQSVEIAALGDDLPEGLPDGLPRSILRTQPAFRENGEILAIPTLGFYRQSDSILEFQSRFSPRKALGGVEFAIV